MTTCFICLSGEDSGFLFKACADEGCKNLYVHYKCMTLLRTTSHTNTCGVCLQEFARLPPDLATVVPHEHHEPPMEHEPPVEHEHTCCSAVRCIVFLFSAMLLLFSTTTIMFVCYLQYEQYISDVVLFIIILLLMFVCVSCAISIRQTTLEYS